MVVAPEAIVEYFSGIVLSIDFCIVGANLVCSCLSSSYLIAAISDTRQLYASVELISNFFVMSAAEFSYTSSLLSAYRFVGSVVIFISLPVSGLPFPLFAPRLSPRSFSEKVYKGIVGDFYCLPALSLRRHHCRSLLPSPLMHSLQARIDRCA
jgi:hypothetical protein